MKICPWCGHPSCVGDQPSYPHHSLCCLDRGWAPCWGSHRRGGGTHTEDDEARAERAVAEDDDPLRPTRAEAEADARYFNEDR